MTGVIQIVVHLLLWHHHHGILLLILSETLILELLWTLEHGLRYEHRVAALQILLMVRVLRKLIVILVLRDILKKLHLLLLLVKLLLLIIWHLSKTGLGEIRHGVLLVNWLGIHDRLLVLLLYWRLDNVNIHIYSMIVCCL